MSKQIFFEYNDKTYTLEFTRDTVRQMEQEGFLAENITTKPLTTLPQLFAGAFKAHHRYKIKPKEIEEIFEKFTNKHELLGMLIAMYNEPVNSLMDDNDDEGNSIAWESNFSLNKD